MKMKQDEGNDGLQKDTIITDSRFLRLHSDPRFQRIPRSHSKVPIDSRFQHMFSDKNFSETLAFDKRGKPKKKKQANPLHQYYYHHNPQGLEGNADNQDEEIDEVGLPSNADATAEIDKKNKNKMKSNGKSEGMSMGVSDDVARDENVHQYTQEAREEGKLDVVTSAVDSAKTKNKKKKMNRDTQEALEEDKLDVVTSIADPAKSKNKKNQNTQEVLEADKLDVVTSIADPKKKKKKKKKKKNTQEALEEDKLDIVISVADLAKKKKKKDDGLGDLEDNMCIDKGSEDNQGIELNSAKNKNKKKKMKAGLSLWEETKHVEEDHEDNQGIENSEGQPEEARPQMKQEVNEANSNVASRSKKKKDGRRLKSSGEQISDEDQLNIAKESQWERTSEDSKKSKLKKDYIFGAAKKANATVEEFQEEELENQDDQETSASKSSSDEYLDVSESETSSSSDEDDQIEPESPKQEEVPTVDRETKRLAVVTMDWNHIKAVDLLVLLNSFLPKGGHILSVAVYPSDFGLKQMAEEAVKGPVAIFESDDESSEDDQSESNNEKLRQYEKARLRYYYAVVECDSCATSDYLYKACDGVEYERTSNVLDLRFIPDDMKFDQPPRDVAAEIPADYQAPDFHTRALQHSRVKLSWDDDEPLRVKTLNRTFKPDQLNEMDFKAYMASDDDGDDNESDDNDGQEDAQDGETKKKGLREKYRSLLLGSGDPSEGEEDKADKDMEITFNTGLEELSKQILEKNQKANTGETVWEAYLRKRREKKKAKKNHPKGLSEDEVNSSDKECANNDEEGNESDDFFLDDAPSDVKEKSGKGIDDTYVKKATMSSGSAGKKGQKLKMQSVEARGEEDANKAELELLIADDHGLENDVRGYNLKFKKSKGHKWKELPSEDKLPTVDYDDPRFSALFTSHHFAIDPTDPQYKRSAAYGRSLAQKQQKKFSENTVDDLKPIVQKELVIDEPSSKKRKAELSSLIRSVKRKVGTLDS